MRFSLLAVLTGWLIAISAVPVLAQETASEPAPGAATDSASAPAVEVPAAAAGEAGAAPAEAAAPPAPAEGEAAVTAPEESVGAATAEAETAAAPEAPAPSRHPHGEGLALPLGLRLNGKFDLSYERYGYTDKIADGKNALRNYHHFLFLSRNERRDPFFFTAEIIDLTFYEIGARFQASESPWRWTFRGGKILVPFGAEPLFHHTYGGLTGFDQPVLPVVWAQHGIQAQARYVGKGWTLSNDLYSVQGHALSATDAVLSLQSDLSKSDDVRFAVGDRLGFGWGPLSVWYSIYYNTLGYGRRLLLQGADVEIYRPTDLPVLRDLAVGFGVLRADVSGGAPGVGGPNFDYYHFADYVDVRYHPAEWVYLQARSGLRTWDNRDGTWIDDNRLDVRDATSHNLGVTFRHHGLSANLTHYWNLEKVDETANDFLRLRIGYDF